MAVRKWLDNEKFLVFWVIVLAAIVRVFFLLRFENMPGDAAGNVARALGILKNPSLAMNFDGNSSTFYKYMISSFMYFWRDPVLAPRVFSLIFGVLLVIPYYGTLKTFFDQRIAFFSSLVLAFYPLHVIQSSVTTSDAAYYFFLFGAFYCFFSYKSERGRFPELWLSALSFNIASLLRFESWIFIPIFFFLLWPEGKKTALLFSGLLLVFPCANLVLCHRYGMPFLYSFTAPGRTAHAEILSGRVPYDPRLWSWPAILWRSSGPSLVIGGLLGVLWAFLTRQKRPLALFFLILWLAFTVNTLSARMAGNKRYGIILALLLIPYAWFFVDRVLVFLKIRQTVFFIFLLIFPAVGFMQRTRSLVTNTSEMFCETPPEIIRIALWLKKNVRADETLLIEADPADVFPANILIRSEISPERCVLVYTPLTQRWSFKNKETSQNYISYNRPAYLVLNSGGFLRNVFGFDWGRNTQRMGDISFKAIFEQEVPGYGQYIIYKGSY